MKLNEVIAIEKGEKNRAKGAITEIYKKVQKDALFTGIARTYAPKDEEGDRLPPERTDVQLTAQRALQEFEQSMTRLLDITATKDWANCEARASVEIDGRVILADVPVSFLLFLEKQLVDMRTFCERLPTLSAGERWSFDENSGLYMSDAVETTRTKKVPRNHVKATATEHHPAQVEVYYEDVIVGIWKKVDTSGALPEAKKRATLDRIDQLSNAIKSARERANLAEVTKREVARSLFDYLLR